MMGQQHDDYDTEHGSKVLQAAYKQSQKSVHM
jgi:hypothetical protein